MTLLTPFYPTRTLDIFGRTVRQLENSLRDTVDEQDTAFVPRANIVEQDKAYLLELELPAVHKNDVEISYKDKVLTVKGKRELKHKVTDDYYMRVESHYGNFTRSWSFEDIDAVKISARAENGIFSITLPKKAEVIESERKKIAID